MRELLCIVEFIKKHFSVLDFCTLLSSLGQIDEKISSFVPVLCVCVCSCVSECHAVLISECVGVPVLCVCVSAHAHVCVHV